MTVILALDQSLTSSGVVIVSVDRQGATLLHLEQVTTRKIDTLCWINDAYQRARILATRLVELIDKFKVTNLVYEALPTRSIGRATRSLGILIGAVLALLPPNLLTGNVEPARLKKFAAGKGNAGKPDMLAAIEPVNPMLYTALIGLREDKGKYDLCDAFWLSQYLIKELDYAL